MMKKIWQKFRSYMLTGVFFIIPVIVMFFVAAKILGFFGEIVAPFAKIIPVESFMGVKAREILAFFLIILLCFLSGILVNHTGGRSIKWLEDNLLTKIPGYSFMKSSGQILAGLEDNTQKQQVVLVKVDEYWQIGFLMGRLTDGRYSVYIPAAPSPWSGNVCIFTEDRVEVIDMEYKEAFRYIKQLGTITDKDTFTKAT